MESAFLILKKKVYKDCANLILKYCGSEKYKEQNEELDKWFDISKRYKYKDCLANNIIENIYEIDKKILLLKLYVGYNKQSAYKEKKLFDNLKFELKYNACMEHVQEKFMTMVNNHSYDPPKPRRSFLYHNHYNHIVDEIANHKNKMREYMNIIRAIDDLYIGTMEYSNIYHITKEEYYHKNGSHPEKFLKLSKLLIYIKVDLIRLLRYINNLK